MSDLDRLLAIRRLMANYRAPATGVLPSATAQDRRPQAYREGAGKPTALAEGLSAFMGQQPRYSVMDPQSDEFRRAREIGEQASVAAEFYGALSPFAAASTMASAQRAGSLLSPLTVFHGSPHKFSKFDASKIGTGEGAQAYGHGLYFAESPAVAKVYQASTSKHKFITGSGYFDPSDLEHINVKATLRKSGLDEAIATARKYGEPDEDYPDVAAKAARDLKKLEAIKASGGLKVNEGSLYTVDLPDEQIAKMLDWDNPLGKQSKEVKKFIDENGKPILDTFADLQRRGLTKGVYQTIWDMPGKTIFDVFGKGGQTEAKLKQAGIPGVRYLDEGSRGKGGTSNFVVFPGEESKLRIMEVNGKPVVINEDEFLQGLLGQ